VRFAALALALLLCACGQPTAGSPPIRIKAEPLPLDPDDPGHVRFDAFTYAGGLVLTSGDTGRLHGLSDLKIDAAGSLIAQGDEGDVLEAHLRLDAKGRPAGLDDAHMSRLVGPDGLELKRKDEADSEGVAVLANGDRLVSFERHDRILLYPAGGGRPRLAPSPDVAFPYNTGMEALAADPEHGADAYLVGSEGDGRLWACKVSGTCVEQRRIAVPPAFGLTAIATLPDGRLAALTRAFDPLRSVRAQISITGRDGAELGRLAMAKPLNIDNFEGLAALPRPDGSIRFYVISDDNFAWFQRTLFMAFDWRPPG
jgi:hypothetical protein